MFDEPFMFDYLETRMQGAPTEQERCVIIACVPHTATTIPRDELARIQAKLSNPLLRQPAPFE